MQHVLSGFYRNILLKSPVFSAIIVVLITVLAAIKLSDVSVDASSDSLVLEGDKSLEVFRDVSKRYGSSPFVLLTYSPNEGNILSDFSLEQLELLKQDLLKVDGVEGVVNIREVPLLYSPPVSITSLNSGIRYLSEKDVDRDLVAKELVNSPVYKNLLSSPDGKTTAIQVKLKTDTTYESLYNKRDELRALAKQEGFTEQQKQALEKAEADFKAYLLIANEKQDKLVQDVRDVLPPYREHATIYLGGVPMITSDMVNFVKNDLVVFGTGIFALIILLLTFFFKRIRWITLPLLTCSITAVCMLGLLGWLDWRLTVISSNFVALLLILTLSVTIHLIVRYRELHVENPGWTNRQLAIETMLSMAKPCLFTTITTIVAFMSLVVSGIRPVIDFGWMMTIGCTMALIIAFIVLPTVLSILSNTDPAKDDTKDVRFTEHFANFTEKFGSAVLIGSLLLAVMSGYGISQLKVENRFIDYFSESTEIYQGMELIDRELGGTIPLDIVITKQPEEKAEVVDNATSEETEEEGGFFDMVDDFFSDDETDDFGGGKDLDSYWFTKAGLEEVETLHDYLDNLDETGKVLSLATLYKLTRDIVGGNVDDIQLALLKNNVDGPIQETLLDPYLDEELNQVRINVRVKETSHTLQRDQLLKTIDAYMQKDLGYQSEEYELTGMLVLYNNMLQSLYQSQIATLGAVFLAIVIMFTLLFRSLLVALIAIAPNLLAASMVLGAMGIIGIPLDMMTITIAAITVGIGVDDTIHYIHRFKNEFAVDRNYHNAMHRSHLSIGKAMYYTSVTIVCGFSILTLSNFTPSIYFGLLTGFAMLSALLGALLLLPKLIIVFKPFGKGES